MLGSLIALAMPAAWAQGGHINFVGMVLEPTCAGDAIRADSLSTQSGETASRHLACGQSAVDAGRTYSRTVQRIDAASVANDRLLGYLASYAPTAGDGKPAVDVVVRTYD
ncbi:hypothetical protein IHE49_05215 [Rhodanobacter sp. 7MK24]|uniref:hypothetical protein n=1 Tax=Rhodanobacter sp. 7MK24 TaxID=2775922 RepID=UPI001784D75B|nr:hypothetical protein [Rhodanobacter sp. 7MK24]MBD8879873.1 hypothetical protein [Rhodanobacter sp. 7MK24]